MAIDERARHQLYLRLEEHLGAEAASTLMEHLPPTGWADVATKRDLDHLAALTQRDLESVRADIESLGGQLRLEMRDVALDLQKTISKQSWMITLTMFSAAVAAAFSALGLR
jgi:uncharacterized protein YbjT (DUF2867 family)